MVKDLDFFLETILYRSHPIQQIASRHSFQSLTGPNAINDFTAVCYHFTIICEFAIQIKQHYPAAFRQITAGDKIIGIRIWLTHRFYDQDPEIIWEATQQDIYILRTQCQALRKQISVQSNPNEEINQ